MKKLLRRIWGFLVSLIPNLDAFIHAHITPTIELVQRLKTAIDSPVADMITALTPTTADDRLKAWISETLGKALAALKATQEIDNAPDLNTKLILLITYLQSLSPSMRKGVIKRFAVEMAIASSGQTAVKGRAIDLVLQSQYLKLVESLEGTAVPEGENWDDNGDGIVSREEIFQHRYN